MPLSNLQLLNSWHAVPLRTRISILVLSIIEAEPHASDAVRGLITNACAMSEMLDEDQRAVIAEFLRQEADLLDAPKLLN
jgi:hypothetical protein